jgi:hypothetical protein
MTDEANIKARLREDFAAEKHFDAAREAMRITDRAAAVGVST